MIQRRNFFKRALAWIGIAGISEGAPLLRKGDRLAVNFTGDTPRPDIYLVDVTRIDRQQLQERKLIGHPPLDGIAIWYQPFPGDNFPPIMKVPQASREYVEKLSTDSKRATEAERLEVALAGVSVAAAGGTSEPVVAKRTDWAWHAAYQDTLDLRRKFDAALRLVNDFGAQGNVVYIYPCGCSAVTSFNSSPAGCYCPDHDPDGKLSNQCTILKIGREHKPPTIEELERILASDNDGIPVTILPNGTVVDLGYRSA